jgi:hypothetical protein
VDRDGRRYRLRLLPERNGWYLAVLGSISLLIASVALLVSNQPSGSFAWSTGALVTGTVAGLIGVTALATGAAASVQRENAALKRANEPPKPLVAKRAGTPKAQLSNLLSETDTELETASRQATFWEVINVGLAFLIALLSGAAGITSLLQSTPISVRITFAILGIVGSALAALSVSLAAGQRHGAMAQREIQLRAFKRTLALKSLGSGVTIQTVAENAAELDRILASTDPEAGSPV